MKPIIYYCLLEIRVTYITDNFSPHLSRAAICGRVHNIQLPRTTKISGIAHRCQNGTSCLLIAALQFGIEEL